jgi:hypothetical protein
LEAFFFLATFLAFFFAAMINSSIVCSGRGDSGHPPKRHQYERLAFANATLAWALRKPVFRKMHPMPGFIGLKLLFRVRIKNPPFRGRLAVSAHFVRITPLRGD